MEITTPNGAVINPDTGAMITPAPTQTSNPTSTPVPTSVSQVPPADIASFQKANPGLTFNNQDLAKYNAATSAPTASAPPVAQPYMGNSIVDYLSHNGSASDFSSRANLAKQYGIANYSGSAAQNTQLLNTLRSNQGGVPNNPATNPTGTVGDAGAINDQNTTQNPDGTTTKGTDPYEGLSPIQKQVKMYQDAYTSLGLNTIKDQFDSFTKQYNDLSKELADKIDEKNNNPWLSSISRSEEVKKIQDSYTKKLDVFSKLATLTEAMYKTGQAQVDHLVTDANADIKATNDLAQKQIDAANALAKDNQVVTIGGREVLINKQTGKQVADLGPSPASVKPGKTPTQESADSLKSDVDNAVSQLQQVVKTKNFKGISPDDYKAMSDYLQTTYGTKGVAALKTALSAVDLKVDTGKNADGTPIKY